MEFEIHEEVQVEVFITGFAL